MYKGWLHSVHNCCAWCWCWCHTHTHTHARTHMQVVASACSTNLGYLCPFFCFLVWTLGSSVLSFVCVLFEFCIVSILIYGCFFCFVCFRVFFLVDPTGFEKESKNNTQNKFKRDFALSVCAFRWCVLMCTKYTFMRACWCVCVDAHVCACVDACVLVCAFACAGARQAEFFLGHSVMCTAQDALEVLQAHST